MGKDSKKEEPKKVQGSQYLALLPLEGWLSREELDEKLGWVWKKRWVLLTNDDEETERTAALSVFKTATAVSALEVVEVHTVKTLLSSETIADKNKFGFIVESTSGKMRLSADSEAIRKRWILTLRDLVPVAKTNEAKKQVRAEAIIRAKVELNNALHAQRVGDILRVSKSIARENTFLEYIDMMEKALNALRSQLKSLMVFGANDENEGIVSHEFIIMADAAHAAMALIPSRKHKKDLMMSTKKLGRELATLITLAHKKEDADHAVDRASGRDDNKDDGEADTLVNRRFSFQRASELAMQLKKVVQEARDSYQDVIQANENQNKTRQALKDLINISDTKVSDRFDESAGAGGGWAKRKVSSAASGIPPGRRAGLGSQRMSFGSQRGTAAAAAVREQLEEKSKEKSSDKKASSSSSSSKSKKSKKSRRSRKKKSDKPDIDALLAAELMLLGDSEPAPDVATFDLVAARSDNKSQYARARVTAVDNDAKTATVLFMNSGESQTVPLDQITNLPEQFSKLKKKGKLDRVTQELTIECRKNAPTTKAGAKDRDLVAVQFGSEEQFFRARVTGVDAASGSAMVLYIDTGETDTVPVDKLLELPEKFQELSEAKQIQNVVTEELTLEIGKSKKKIPAKNVTTENLVAVQFGADEQFFRARVTAVNPANNTAQVIYIDTGESDVIQLDDVHEVPEKFTTENVAAGYESEEEVETSSHRLKRARKKLDKELAGICNKAEADVKIESVKEGALFAVQSSEDDEVWFRGKVLSVDGDTVEVSHIDTGKSGKAKVDSLRKLPEKLAELEPLVDKSKIERRENKAKLKTVIKSLSTHCNKLEEGADEVESPKKGQMLAAHSSDDDPNWFRARVVAIDDESNTVNVQNIDTGLVESLPLAFVRTIPAEFVALPAQANPAKALKAQNKIKLQSLMRDLSLYSSKAPSTGAPVKANTMVAAHSGEDDELWFRGKVVDVDMDHESAEVVDIDTGRTEYLPFSELRPLPKRYQALPAQADVEEEEEEEPKAKSSSSKSSKKKRPKSPRPSKVSRGSSRNALKVPENPSVARTRGAPPAGGGRARAPSLVLPNGMRVRVNSDATPTLESLLKHSAALGEAVRALSAGLDVSTTENEVASRLVTVSENLATVLNVSGVYLKQPAVKAMGLDPEDLGKLMKSLSCATVNFVEILFGFRESNDGDETIDETKKLRADVAAEAVNTYLVEYVDIISGERARRKKREEEERKQREEQEAAELAAANEAKRKKKEEEKKKREERREAKRQTKLKKAEERRKKRAAEEEERKKQEAERLEVIKAEEERVTKMKEDLEKQFEGHDLTDLEKEAKSELDGAAQVIDQAASRLAKLLSERETQRKERAAAREAAKQKAQAEGKEDEVKRIDDEEAKDELDDESSDALLTSVRALTATSAGLIRAAIVAQAEIVQLRVDAGEDEEQKEKYNVDPAWAKGLVSAAQMVAAHTQQTVETATAKQVDDVSMIAAAKGVSGATARLTSAARSKLASSESTAYQQLGRASKEVKTSTTLLIECVQQLREEADSDDESDDEEEELEAQPVAALAEKVVPAETKSKAAPAIDKSDPGGAFSIAKEFEAQQKILRLERDLDIARRDLAKMRKAKYAK